MDLVPSGKNILPIVFFRLFLCFGYDSFRLGLRLKENFFFLAAALLRNSPA
jgi:hypothetical protein